MKKLAFLLFLTVSVTFTTTKQAENRSQKQTIIIAPLAIGEFLDKLTILIIKREQINDPAKRINIDKEFDLLNSIYQKELPSSPSLSSLLDQLLTINKILWNLENITREKEQKKEFDDEFKQTAKSILENNDTRFAIKRAINMLLDSTLIEEKSYTETLAREIDTDISLTSQHKNSTPIIHVPISVADLIDRITILEIKLDVITDDEKQINIQYEYETLLSIYKKNIESTEELEELYKNLLETNKDAWNIHDKIRQKVLDNELDDEFVELARGVYLFNDKRSSIKNMMNRLFASTLIDEKKYN